MPPKSLLFLRYLGVSNRLGRAWRLYSESSITLMAGLSVVTHGSLADRDVAIHARLMYLRRKKVLLDELIARLERDFQPIRSGTLPEISDKSGEIPAENRRGLDSRLPER